LTLEVIDAESVLDLPGPLCSHHVSCHASGFPSTRPTGDLLQHEVNLNLKFVILPHQREFSQTTICLRRIGLCATDNILISRLHCTSIFHTQQLWRRMPPNLFNRRLRAKQMLQFHICRRLLHMAHGSTVESRSAYCLSHRVLFAYRSSLIRLSLIRLSLIAYRLSLIAYVANCSLSEYAYIESRVHICACHSTRPTHP
jgi:hypothetical protein